MTFYEYTDLEGNIRIREIGASLMLMKINHKAISGISFQEFETRDGYEGIMYYDDFFKRIIVAIEESK